MSGGANFLDTIIERKRARLVLATAARSLAEVRCAAVAVRQSSPVAHALRAALGRDDRINVIAEIKRASPSKGDIRGAVDPAALVRKYEANGAAAVSVLTEEDFFKGSLEDLRVVKSATRLPVLRKDFTISEWQIYEAAGAGADAVLLIVAALDDELLTRLRRVAEDELEMDALVEVHDAAELRRALACGATVIGVNNRNLRTFEVSLEVSVEVIKGAPENVSMISESGLRTHDDLRQLRDLGYRGFLVGETLMRAESPGAALRELIQSEEDR